MSPTQSVLATQWLRCIQMNNENKNEHLSEEDVRRIIKEEIENFKKSLLIPIGNVVNYKENA